MRHLILSTEQHISAIEVAMKKTVFICDICKTEGNCNEFVLPAIYKDGVKGKEKIAPYKCDICMKCAEKLAESTGMKHIRF